MAERCISNWSQKRISNFQSFFQKLKSLRTKLNQECHKSKKLKENLLEDKHARKLKITSYIEKITNDDFERLKALFLDEFSHYNIHALNDHWEKRFFSHTTYSLLWIEFVENIIQS